MIDNYDRGYYISKRGKNGKGGITLSTSIQFLSNWRQKNAHKKDSTEKKSQKMIFLKQSVQKFSNQIGNWKWKPKEKKRAEFKLSKF